MVASSVDVMDGRTASGVLEGKNVGGMVVCIITWGEGSVTSGLAAFTAFDPHAPRRIEPAETIMRVVFLMLNCTRRME
jgi:hypothetical protein